MLTRKEMPCVENLQIAYCVNQWFPTGVPRHPGVPFTVPRGAAG